MIDKASSNQLESFLSESVQQVLDDNFQKDLWNVKLISSQMKVKEYDQFIAVTISSIKFKCLVFLHLQDDSEFQTFIFDTMGITSKNCDQLFYDSLSEMSNSIIGSLKRKLEYSYTTIGMSTPTLLNQISLDFFLNSSATFKIQIEADLNNRFHLGVSLFLYVDKKYDFSLKPPVKNEADLESGELLLF